MRIDEILDDLAEIAEAEVGECRPLDEQELPHTEIFIRLSDIKRSHERQVYTYMMLLGDFGGFNAAVLSIPALFMSFYAEKMFKAAVLEEITAVAK